MMLSRIANRNWIQWSLRSLLVLMFLLAIGFAWWGAKLRKEARLKEAVRLVAASPGWFPSDGYDPIALVRAVNALHSLGKEDAIEALHCFARECPSNWGPEDRHEALRLIIPLLFDRLDPEDRFPFVSASEGPGPYRLTQKDLNQKEWHFFSDFVAVEGDVPFHLVDTMGFSGAMNDFSYAIDWAQNCGRFRASPLTPDNSPFAAADRLLVNLARTEQKPISDDVSRHIREQVLTTISHLLPPSEIDKYKYMKNWDGSELSASYCSLAKDANWATLRKTGELIGIHWSANQQAYVADRAEPDLPN